MGSAKELILCALQRLPFASSGVYISPSSLVACRVLIAAAQLRSNM
jgi:hypothetical protein